MTANNHETTALMGAVEVGKYLGIAERTIYMWAQQGKIPAFKVGSVWRFKRSDVEQWLEANRSGPRNDDIAPLTPRSEPARSKWRLKKDEEEANQAMFEACRAYIETTLKSVGREIFTVEQFEGRFGEEVVDKVIRKLKREKKISEGTHQGLNGEKVRIIKERE